MWGGGGVKGLCGGVGTNDCVKKSNTQWSLMLEGGKANRHESFAINDLHQS